MRTEYNLANIIVNNHVCLIENEHGCIFTNMTYGQRLKKAMEHAKITQNELSEKVGYDQDGKLRVTQANISKLINQTNIRGSAHTARFARICGVSEDWLAYEEGDMLDGLYVHDTKLKQLLMVAEPLTDYAVDELIHQGLTFAKLVQEAKTETKK